MTEAMSMYNYTQMPYWPEQMIKGSEQQQIYNKLYQNKRYTIDFLNTLFDKVQAVLSQEKGLMRIDGKNFIVVGDLHGDLISLYSILAKYQQPIEKGEYKIVFLGDYIDRGPHSLEVLVTLLQLKLKYPKSVILLRGNHEENTYQESGREFLLKRIYRDTPMEVVTVDMLMRLKVFNYLSICAILDGRFFCVHGGIPLQVSCTGYIDPDFRTKLEAQKLPIIFPKHVNWTTISNPETSTKVNKYNDQFIKVPPPEYGPNHPYIQMLWNDVNMKKNSTSPGYTDEYGYDSFRGLSFPISAIADLNTIMDTEFFVRGHQHEMQPFPLEHDKKFVNVISSLYLPYLKTKGLQNNLGILIINDKDIKFEKIADLEKEDVLAIQHKLIDAFGDDIINECKYVTGIFNQNSGNKTIVKEGDTPYYFGSLVIEAQPKTTSASSPSGVSVDLLPSSNPIGSSGGGKPKSVPKPPKSRYQLAEIPPYRGSSDHFRSRALSPQPTSDSSGHPKSQTPISPNISYDTPLQDKNKDQAGQQ